MIHHHDQSASPGYAVLDLETTGLRPAAGARIIEIGIVFLDPDLHLSHTWETLVDAGGDPGPTQIHGIDQSMLQGAPSFAQLAAALATQLDGRVVVAHNAKFDVGFLDAEFSRIGRQWSRDPLCTLQLARRRRLPLKLGDCCAHFGIVNHGAHHALGDALATAELLSKLEVQSWEIPAPVFFAEQSLPIDEALHLKPRDAAPTNAEVTS